MRGSSFVLLCLAFLFVISSSFALTIMVPTQALARKLDDKSFLEFQKNMSALCKDPDLLSRWDEANGNYWRYHKYDQEGFWKKLMEQADDEFKVSIAGIRRIGEGIVAQFPGADEKELGLMMVSWSASMDDLWQKNTSWLDRINKIPHDLMNNIAASALAVKYKNTGLRRLLHEKTAEMAEFFKTLKIMRQFMLVQPEE